MEKNPPLSKIYEALSAVADQRIDIQADRAYVLSSDHAKRYTVKFLENGYSSNDNATLWQHYPGYPILDNAATASRCRCCGSIIQDIPFWL